MSCVDKLFRVLFLFYYNKGVLTKRQKEILGFIGSFQQRKGYSPSLDEIRKKFHLASSSTAHFHVARLNDLGYITKETRGPRSISVISQGTASGLMVVRDDPDTALYRAGFDAPRLDLSVSDRVSAAEMDKPAQHSLPHNKVILGDAIAGMKKLPDESCDIIIADPPYNVGKDFGNNTDRRELGDYLTLSNMVQCVDA